MCPRQEKKMGVNACSVTTHEPIQIINMCDNVDLRVDFFEVDAKSDAMCNI